MKHEAEELNSQIESVSRQKVIVACVVQFTNFSFLFQLITRVEKDKHQLQSELDDLVSQMDHVNNAKVPLTVCYANS